ncbi:GAF domain-containing sensor histidine kinase [Gramella sp. MAR_2010_147]|uniref:GAF domain-containing sensor histidine kinase n=1 Tax=Gramella sp. MAR_2010_147 TaxID=1250205 RepID=UPI00087D1D30|nr:GAF domain-containing sensor histidine kinase [Gramella sp. MAR_2010_147]SDR91954.1 His Kinase A (phospho-acceptor) domain-containing protein [Gramella sp. MAR_2010_147]
MNNNLSIDLQEDVQNISQISSIPSMLNVICRTTGMRFAAVARVTDKKWVTCLSQDEIDFGLKPGDELELQTTICNEIRQHTEPVVIDNVPENKKYCNHHTPAKYGFKSYISFPIFRKDGSFFGTLCAIDPEPAKLENQQTYELFQLYTELISFHLETIEELKNTNQTLLEEKKNAKLRETFIAILGHDLRNPLTTTRLCSDILLKMEIDDNAKKYVGTIKSTSLRMQELIDNVLDFAKGELGEGISLVFTEDNDKLKKELKQIIKETETTDLSHKIVSSIDLDHPVKCDSNRIGQLFSNLLSNAVKHGHDSTPIYINSTTTKEQFILEVINSSDTIPSDILNDIFKPFTSISSVNNVNGLGLGLYIASEIAKAHNGKIDVISDNNKTTFKFRMPI